MVTLTGSGAVPGAIHHRTEHQVELPETLQPREWPRSAACDEGSVNKLLLNTTALTTPCKIVEGSLKWCSRVKALKTVVDWLSEELDCVPSDSMARAARESKRARTKRP